MAGALPPAQPFNFSATPLMQGAQLPALRQPGVGHVPGPLLRLPTPHRNEGRGAELPLLLPPRLPVAAHAANPVTTRGHCAHSYRTMLLLVVSKCGGSREHVDVRVIFNHAWSSSPTLPLCWLPPNPRPQVEMEDTRFSEWLKQRQAAEDAAAAADAAARAAAQQQPPPQEQPQAPQEQQQPTGEPPKEGTHAEEAKQQQAQAGQEAGQQQVQAGEQDQKQQQQQPPQGAEQQQQGAEQQQQGGRLRKQQEHKDRDSSKEEGGR